MSLFAGTVSPKPTHEDIVIGLYDQTRPALLIYLAGLGLTLHEAEDVIHDSFVRLYDHLQTSKRNDNLRGWLFRVCHNRAIDLFRQARRFQLDTEETTIFDFLIDVSLTPEEQATLRVPSLSRGDLALLARIGALNQLEGVAHRRDALWQVERAGKLEGPLLRQQSEWLKEENTALPLDSMSDEERLVADYAGMGLTVGHHPMHYRRKELQCRGFLTASDLQRRKTGDYVRTARLAIVKQRPGTANGMVFMSIADETGIFNVMVTKEFFERNRETVVLCKFISLEGPLQNEGGVVHVRSTRMSPLPQRGLEVESHDFH